MATAWTGRSSYGLGFSTIEGVVEAGTMHYRWKLGQWTGRGVLNHADGYYIGEWSNDDPAQGSGVIRLMKTVVCVWRDASRQQRR